VDFADSILEEDRTTSSSATSVIRRSRGYLGKALRPLLLAPNMVARRNAARLVGLLRDSSRKPRLLVVGGGSVGSGLEQFYSDPNVEIISFDIYATEAVQFVADAHSIPLQTGSIDGVIVQAVLEHVLEPCRVVAEIHRVLRPGGLVYADTPFLQQVHEGAYDFTRFTESGHRYLFRWFERLDSGVVSSAGTQLRWSIAYFFRGVTRSRTVGKLAMAAFFWLRWFDRLIPENFGVDSASAVFFLGRRSETEVRPVQMVAEYRGADRRDG
jgi:SAM-dependent methyltransferase